jgi:hypothetical protein
MSGRKTRQSTLGELIAAVTDEVDPLMKNSASTPIVVSLILQDLFARRRVRLRKRLPPRGGW